MPEATEFPAIPLPAVEAPIKERQFLQRLYGLLGDLADLVAVQEGVSGDQVSELLNKWTTDEPMEDTEVGRLVGRDTLMLIEGMKRNRFSEEEVGATVDEWLESIPSVEDAFNPQPTDILDRLVGHFDRELQANKNVVAYLTAHITGQDDLGHEIIDDGGCTLVHDLTDMLLSYMVGRTTLPEGDDADVLLDYVRDLGFKNAELDSMNHEQKRAYIHSRFHRNDPQPFYDQDEDD